jgi:DNA-binding CsgD family transcriptional regulator
MLLEAMTQRELAGMSGAESVEDADAAWRRLERFGRTTRQTMVSLHAGDPPDDDDLARTMAPLYDLIHRDVAVRIVCPRSFAAPAHIRRVVDDLTEHEAEVRFADALPHRFLVADHASAAVPLGGNRLADGAVFVHEQLLVDSLDELARRVFRCAVPLAEIPTDGSDIGPSPVERRIVWLLGSGVTDAVAARRLSITERQYRRYVAKVMTRLGATSRFQAGVRAVERGWL